MPRHGGDRPATATDVDRMPPAVAAAAITAFSRPGEVVCDPDCGAGTVLVEALWAGRHAIGRPRGRGGWPLARSNITAAKRAGACGDGTVLAHHPDIWSTTSTAGVAGQIRLALTALRRIGSQPSARTHGASALAAEAGYSRLADTLAGVVPLLHPHAHVIITVPPARNRDGYWRTPAAACSPPRKRLG